jgi:DNA polymerase
LEVYDIVNCGPRQRFVVRGADGPFIVHNCVQAVSRDLLAYAMMGLDAAGYPIVLHVHDEIVAEVPAGAGDIGEFEKIMGTMPSWASGWPIRAAGGWRGLRYRKE